MLLKSIAALGGALALTLAGPAAEVAPPPADGGRTLVVEMVDRSPTEFAFEPATITVRPGDVVRFVQAGVAPHNVEFKQVPASTDLGELRMGPFLTAKGQAYEVVIDERFAEGTHRYVCTPHEAMGMKGAITVVSETHH